jgi:3-methyladenine DNA glycosylase AlkD
MANSKATLLIRKTLKALVNPDIAEHSRRFFKTGKGEYAEGDQFLGIRVPVLRQQARKFHDVKLVDIRQLIKSEFHEERLLALIILVNKFAKGSERDRAAIYKLYLSNTKHINNWDLVDSSAYQIVGGYIEDKDRIKLRELAVSDSLWERRIAIIATFQFIRNNQFKDTLGISKLLLNDEEDLIHKAVGWMLREVGKRDSKLERTFLKSRYQRMPRTMLRYAIEKFPERERMRYLNGRV